MGEDQDYSSPQEVDYRGEFKPELSQLLSQAQMQMMDGAEFADDDMGEMTPLTQEQLEEMMKNSAELDIQEGQDGEEMSPELAGDARKPAQRDAAPRPAGSKPILRTDAARRRRRRAAHTDSIGPIRVRRMGLPRQRVQTALVYGARERDEQRRHQLLPRHSPRTRVALDDDQEAVRTRDARDVSQAKAARRW